MASYNALSGSSKDEDDCLEVHTESEWSSDDSGTTISDSDSDASPNPENHDLRVVVMGDDSFHVENVEPEDSGVQLVSFGPTTGSMCPICPKRFSRIKRHIVSAHIPWYLNPSTACFSCEEQCGSKYNLLKQHANCPQSNGEIKSRWSIEVLGFLRTLIKCLKLQNQCDLLDFVVRQQLYPTSANCNECYNSPFTKDEIEWLSYYEEVCAPDYEQNTSFTTSPPNRIVGILHWRTILNVLNLLPESVKKDLAGSRIDYKFT